MNIQPHEHILLLISHPLLHRITVIVVQVDPQIPLPQSFINFIMKNLAGVFLTLFHRQVIKVSYESMTYRHHAITSNPVSNVYL